MSERARVTQRAAVCRDVPLRAGGGWPLPVGRVRLADRNPQAGSRTGVGDGHPAPPGGGAIAAAVAAAGRPPCVRRGEQSAPCAHFGACLPWSRRDSPSMSEESGRRREIDMNEEIEQVAEEELPELALMVDVPS